jgi:hypothetical protein
MDGFIHAHPLLFVAAFTVLAVGVFFWALFDGADMPDPELQQGGDWQWPETTTYERRENV